MVFAVTQSGGLVARQTNPLALAGSGCSMFLLLQGSRPRTKNVIYVPSMLPV